MTKATTSLIIITSVDLAKELLQHETYYCDTTRSNLKKYPAVFKGVHLDRGQHKSQTVGNVHSFVWKDKNFNFIQTICDPSESGTVKRKNKDGSYTVVSCPLPVKIYIEKMAGVSLADSKRQVYSCSHKSKKWWH